MSVPGLKIELIETSACPNVSVARRSPQPAVNVFQRFRTVAAVQVHLSLEAVHLDLPVARAQVDFTFARDLDNNVHAMLAPFDGEIMMRKPHVDLHRVAILMLFNADAVFTDLVMRRDYLGLDRVLVPRRDANVGIGSLDPQVRLAT